MSGRVTEVPHHPANGQPGGVARDGLVQIAASLLAASQDPLLGEPVHDRHHGRIGELRRPTLVHAAQELPYADRLADCPRRPDDIGCSERGALRPYADDRRLRSS